MNIPQGALPAVFREMARVLEPGALLLLSFHIGNETIHPGELLGHAEHQSRRAYIFARRGFCLDFRERQHR